MPWLNSTRRSSTDKGRRYEDIALRYLKQNGLKLLTRNYFSKYGEIDLIMQDQDTLVFVEVRYRKHAHFVSAIESVDYHKQSRIANTAEDYLQTHPWSGPCRFDIVTIQKKTQLQWIVGAFDAP